MAHPEFDMNVDTPYVDPVDHDATAIAWYRDRARSAENQVAQLRSTLLEIATGAAPREDAPPSQWKAALYIAMGSAAKALGHKISN